MTKRLLIILIILVSSSRIVLVAQFLNMQIRVEPELSASVEQNLDFGDLITGTGQSFVNLGDINMGIFNIRAYYTQNIFVTLETPSSLIHQNPAITDEIPISLSIAYDNSNLPSAGNAIILSNNEGLVALYPQSEINNIQNNQVWQNLELYVFGFIEVGYISDGNYIGQVVLNVDYD